MMPEVYYRLYLNCDDLVTVVCMQDFDEYDYNQSRFFKDENGNSEWWDREDKAIEFLNKRFKVECIHPDYRTPNNRSFWKEMEHDS